MRIPTPESGVLKACMDLLAAERIWFERRNTRTMKVEQKDKRTGRTRERPIFFGIPGTADIMATPMKRECVPPLYIRNLIQILWIECKSDIGTQTPDQINFQRTVEAAGHYYIVVRDVNELIQWLKEHRNG